MGFMDKAKGAAEDLKASFASNEVRESEQAYRDLGMLAYLTTTGRPIDEADRQRLVNTLWMIEQQGKLPAFRLVAAAPPPPLPPQPTVPPAAAPAPDVSPAPVTPAPEQPAPTGAPEQPAPTGAPEQPAPAVAPEPPAAPESPAPDPDPRDQWKPPPA